MTAPNPFAERSEADDADRDLVAAAVDGERAALEQLLLRHQAWIYNLAVRMVWEPADAEDVTQEVLVKVVTKLSTFRGEAGFRTWLYRLVANHVLNMKRRHHEQTAVSFSQFGEQLANAPELELPDPRSLPVDVPMLVDEAKLHETAVLGSDSIGGPHRCRRSRRSIDCSPKNRSSARSRRRCSPRRRTRSCSRRGCAR